MLSNLRIWNTVLFKWSGSIRWKRIDKRESNDGQRFVNKGIFSNLISLSDTLDAIEQFSAMIWWRLEISSALQQQKNYRNFKKNILIKPVRYLISIKRRSPIKTEPPLSIKRCWFISYKPSISSPCLTDRFGAIGVTNGIPKGLFRYLTRNPMKI